VERLDEHVEEKTMAAPKPVRAMSSDRLKVFTGNANPALAEEICQCLGMELGRSMAKLFSDCEIYLQIQENVRGADVFVIQPTCTPVDRHLMEILLMIDALKRASAERITAVLPYYGYARQDRKDKPRVPSRPNWWPRCCKRRARTGFWRWTCTPRRFKAFSMSVDHLFAAW
jgi:ribose-phosphate pyrophosphokinase